MKFDDLKTERERELMRPYFENRGPVRQKLIDVVSIMDKGEGKKGAESPVYIFWDPLLTDEMCDLLKHMKLRKPMYISELARKSGNTVEYVAKLGHEIACTGALEYWPDERGIDRLYMPQLCVGSLEWAMLNAKRIEEHPEEALLFEKHIQELCDTNGPMMPMTNHGVHRAVPIESALTPDVRRMEWEELSKIIERNAEDTYAVVNCICRQGTKITGVGSGEPSLEWCLCMGHLADYCIRTGVGRKISKEEFLHIMREGEKRGFVHNVANANGKDQVEYICNCDYKTCYTLRADLYTQSSSMTRSNFVAQVDVNKCTACGSCVETCPMNAVRMGQRLDPKKPLQYHYKDNPHEHLKWDKERYRPDYLYERENVWSETGTAPCKSNCPAHISVEGYLRLAALGRYDDALKLIKKNNPLPAVCGSVCNRRCESACTRGKIDQPIAIDEVKKFLAYRELQKEQRYIPEKKTTWKEGKKVAVIGSGPAGLSCAYYLLLEGEQVTVFEKNEKVGGMLQYGIPSFRLEKQIIEAEIDVIRQLGAEFRTGVEVGKDVTLDELRAQGYEAFYLALGASKGTKVGCKGDDLQGVMTGVDFLRQVNDGHAPEIGRHAAVIGGGNVALDVARTARRLGAEVTVIYRRTEDKMPAAVDENEEAREEGIQFRFMRAPAEILGDGTVEAIKLELMALDENMKPMGTGEYETLSVSAVLSAIGQKVDMGGIEGFEQTAKGTLAADPQTFQTNIPDVFAGGDLVSGPKFAIDAIAAGKEAAESIHRYVWGGNLLSGRDRNLYADIDKNNVDFGSYDDAGRQIPGRDGRKKLSFSDDRQVFTEEQVKAETARCLRCGASHVDENMCIGCAVCTTRCQFDAIHIRRVFETEPCVREKLVPDCIKEMGRRAMWNIFNKPESKTVDVGTTIDASVSHATGAVYCKPPKEN